MDVKYQRRCKPRLGISWSMTAMLRDVVVVVGRAHPRSMPLAMFTIKKELHGLILFVEDIKDQKSNFVEKMTFAPLFLFIYYYYFFFAKKGTVIPNVRGWR